MSQNSQAGIFYILLAKLDMIPARKEVGGGAVGCCFGP